MSPLQGEDILMSSDPRVARETRLPWAILLNAFSVQPSGYSTIHVSPLLISFSRLPGPAFAMAASIWSTIMSS
jgi:hypothetical protein